MRETQFPLLWFYFERGDHLDMVSLNSAIQHGVSSGNSYWQMSRAPVIQQAVSNAWLKQQGLLSVKYLWWCKAQGYTT